MKKTLIIFIIIIVLGGLALATKFSSDRESPYQITSVTPHASIEFGSLTETYINDTYRFEFKHPANFTVLMYGGPDGDILTLQNEKSEGFQIRIQQIYEDITTITPEMIQQDIPGLVVDEPQEVSLGTYGKGVAFASNDPAFDGKSREVWFVYKKTLYQLSTYMTYDSFAQAVLSTWKFK